MSVREIQETHREREREIERECSRKTEGWRERARETDLDTSAVMRKENKQEHVQENGSISALLRCPQTQLHGAERAGGASPMLCFDESLVKAEERFHSCQTGRRLEMDGSFLAQLPVTPNSCVGG